MSTQVPSGGILISMTLLSAKNLHVGLTVFDLNFDKQVPLCVERPPGHLVPSITTYPCIHNRQLVVDPFCLGHNCEFAVIYPTSTLRFRPIQTINDNCTSPFLLRLKGITSNLESLTILINL